MFRVKNMTLNMPVNDFEHKTVQRAPTGRNQLKRLVRILLLREHALERFELALNAANAGQKFPFVSNRV
jgi:hypothetical protein